MIAFDDTIVDMLVNKIFNQIEIELSIRCRKLNNSLAFTTQSYFAVTKNIRVNYTHYFIMKISNERGFQQIAIIHSSDIDFKDYGFLTKICCKTILFFS